MMRALHDEHAGAVYAFVRRYEPDPQRAEDVVQEAFLRVWRGIDRLDTKRRSLRAYLFTVARNVLTDLWRAQQRRPTLVADQDALARVPAEDEVERALDDWLVAEALTRLSYEHRRVVEEMYFHGRTVADAAAVLGIPEGTVKSRAYYAVRALRSAFEELGVTR
ncbi:sigma-70 family RNA polymerase sigma factor [Micromonospora sp. NPDC047465]|uniref:sigma-70 family RNA polymerase sigma factor n=1 Tax=Micromonospora sp. NPDC047465 TaxID=3154813 RepID=UPI00340081CF